MSKHLKNNSLLGATVIVCLTPSIVMACSCLGGITEQQYFYSAQAVFRGVVQSVSAGEDHNKVVVLKVGKSWKGVGTEKVTLITPSDSAACGIEFREKQEYLVFASKSNRKGQLHTGLCDGTISISNPDRTFPILDKLKAKFTKVKPKPEKSS